MTKRMIALLLCASTTSACATAGASRVQASPGFTRSQNSEATGKQAAEKTLLAEYVQKLALGTKVRVDRIDGRPVTGTLMKATDAYIVVQRRTRYPESPEQIPLDRVAGVTPQGSNSIGKAIAIGAGAGAAAALGVILILIAAYSD